MSIYEFDVLIIGCGIAGLSTALKVAESDAQVGIITRAQDPHESNTYYAQGGIIYPRHGDTSLGDDIYKASAASSNPDAIKVLEERSGKILEELLLEKSKTSFERNTNGDLKYTREAAHSLDRILYRGDFTGQEIQVSLLNYLKDSKRFPNVKFLTNHTAIDLLTPLHHGISIQQRYEEGRVVGAYVLNRENNEVSKILAKITVLATGGLGALYLHHSNSDGARGDGHAMAKRAGAVLTDMEFIQFHPTTFYDASSDRRFLISEALRGEGGILLNRDGNAFMHKYHADKELAPRDVVSRSILEEMIETRHDYVYLDISHKNSDWLKKRFPKIYQHCLNSKIDITKDPIPVVPAAHYTCGGIKTDMSGRTNIKNLFAVGEVACTGLHGANRLASTSLLEGLTWGYLAAEEIVKVIFCEEMYKHSSLRDWVSQQEEADEVLIAQDWLSLKQTMWNYVGLIRTKNRLGRADAMFRELYLEFQQFYKQAQLTDSLIGLRNAVEVGSMVLSSSQRNQKSIGCFYRKN